MDEQEEWFLNYLREGNGLLAMSSGYEYEIQIHKSKKEKKAIKKYKVMEGPLKVYEDKIKKVDKHERLAFLDFEVNGWCAQAGFNCLPRSHWEPKNDSNIVRFDDGSEADLAELKNKIMTIK